MFEIETSEKPAKIKVIGAGGGGINAVNYMISEKLDGVEFVAVDTDERALENSQAPCKIQFDSEKISSAVAGSDIIFVVGGSEKIAPVIAECAKKSGALTVAAVSSSESSNAEIQNWLPRADSVIIAKDNDIFFKAVQAVTALVAVPGVVNLDLDDVKTVMKNSGVAVVGIGEASGENATVNAANATLSELDIRGAKSLLMNITGASEALHMAEIHEASMIIQNAAAPDAVMMWGMATDDSLGDTVRVTIIATHFGDSNFFEQVDS